MNLNAAGSVQNELNTCMPAAAHAKLGDILYDLLLGTQQGIISPVTLAIKAGSSAIVKNTAAFLYKLAGQTYNKLASDMSALVGTLATAKSAAWAFYIDSTGTITTAAKTADVATHLLALQAIAAAPAGQIMIGIVVVDNATGSNFVGGTTALDVGSLTVTYYNLTSGRPTQFAVLDLESRT